MSRWVILDTETTGNDPRNGHRVIEVGCVELIERRRTGRTFQAYLNPDRDSDEGALQVHGLTREFLADKPRFPDIAERLRQFLLEAEVIIHNAPFDLGFLDAELQRLPTQYGAVRELCAVIDTLVMARAKHPGQRNNLDALCQRYDVDNSQRDLHGALLDAEILADVYLAMTGGQTTFQLSDASANSGDGGPGSQQIRRLATGRAALPVIAATPAERSAHEAQLDAIAASSGGRVLWRELAERGLA